MILSKIPKTTKEKNINEYFYKNNNKENLEIHF